MVILVFTKICISPLKLRLSEVLIPVECYNQQVFFHPRVVFLRRSVFDKARVSCFEIMFCWLTISESICTRLSPDVARPPILLFQKHVIRNVIRPPQFFPLLFFWHRKRRPILQTRFVGRKDWQNVFH